MVRDVEEHTLLQKIEDLGHPEIAKVVLDVLNKRDRQLEDIYNKHIEIEKKQIAIFGKLEAIDRKLQDHLIEEKENFQHYMSIIDSAFPSGDVRGHCDMHEKWIQKEEQRIAFRQAIIDKSLASLVWAGLVFLGYAVWNYTKQNIHF